MGEWSPVYTGTPMKIIISVKWTSLGRRRREPSVTDGGESRLHRITLATIVRYTWICSSDKRGCGSIGRTTRFHCVMRNLQRAYVYVEERRVSRVTIKTNVLVRIYRLEDNKKRKKKKELQWKKREKKIRNKSRFQHQCSFHLITQSIKHNSFWFVLESTYLIHRYFTKEQSMYLSCLLSKSWYYLLVFCFSIYELMQIKCNNSTTYIYIYIYFTSDSLILRHLM